MSGWGQGRQPPEAVARSASLEASRSQGYINTVAPRRRIRLATVAGGLAAHRKPGWARRTSASLTPATGARTTRLCRPQLPRPTLRPAHVLPEEILAKAFKRRSSARCCSLTEDRPANTFRARRCCVHRIPSHVRDDRDTPLFSGQDGASSSADLPDGLSGIFLREDWTTQITLIGLKKSAFWRNGQGQGFSVVGAGSRGNLASRDACHGNSARAGTCSRS